jgi:PhnB protein
MTTSPTGYSTVQPWLVTRDTGRLLDFVSAAFGGEEVARVATEDGGIGHAEIRVGDSMLLAFDARPDWPATPSMLRVFVDDAVAAGGRVVTALDNSAWGDRGGRIRHPLGNIWWVVQHVADVEPAEIATRMQDPRYAEAMRQAQATLDAELSGRTDGWSSPPVL